MAGEAARGNAPTLLRAVNPAGPGAGWLFPCPCGTPCCAGLCQGKQPQCRVRAAPLPRGRASGRPCRAGAASVCLLCPAAPSFHSRQGTKLPVPAPVSCRDKRLWWPFPTLKRNHSRLPSQGCEQPWSLFPRLG